MRGTGNVPERASYRGGVDVKRYALCVTRYADGAGMRLFALGLGDHQVSNALISPGLGNSRSPSSAFSWFGELPVPKLCFLLVWGTPGPQALLSPGLGNSRSPSSAFSAFILDQVI